MLKRGFCWSVLALCVTWFYPLLLQHRRAQKTTREKCCSLYNPMVMSMITKQGEILYAAICVFKFKCSSSYVEWLQACSLCNYLLC